MENFTLPLGAFQIHFFASLIIDTVPLLQKALQAHDALLEVAYAENPGKSPLEALSIRVEEFEDSFQKIKEASEKFQKSLKGSEFPYVLPQITIQLIYASIVAQAFQLSFEVSDYKRNDDGKDRSSWLVTGRVIDKHDRQKDRIVNSFSFDKSNDEMAAGALLSACGDAFISCVFAAVPHFPLQRE